MKQHQWEWLNTICEDAPGIPIKYYVYKMTAASVHREKAKMEFDEDFTQTYLTEFINEGQFNQILVESATSKKRYIVNLKRVEGTNKAVLSGGWPKAARRFRLNEGGIYMFGFIECPRYGLNLMISPL